MESHLLDDLAVPLLSSLSRRTESLTDLARGDPGRPNGHQSIDYLTLTTCTSRRAKVS
jgi:hypothetical protein